MAKKKKNLSAAEMQKVLADLAMSTARTPATASAAEAIGQSAQGNLEAEYAKRLEEQEKKAKKAKIAGTLGRIITKPLDALTGGIPIASTLGESLGRQLGGADESFGESLQGAAQNSVVDFGMSKIASGGSELLGNLGSSTKMTPQMKAAQGIAEQNPGTFVAEDSLAVQTKLPAEKQGFLAKVGGAYKDAASPENIANTVGTSGLSALAAGLKNDPYTKPAKVPYGLSGEAQRSYRQEATAAADRAKQFELQQQQLGLQKEGMQSQERIATAREQGETSRFNAREQAETTRYGEILKSHTDLKTLTADQAMKERELITSLNKDEAQARTAHYNSMAAKADAQYKLELERNTITKEQYGMEKTLNQTRLNIIGGKPEKAGNLLDFIRQDKTLADQFAIIEKDPVTGSTTSKFDHAGFIRAQQLRLKEFYQRGLISSPAEYEKVMQNFEDDLAATQRSQPPEPASQASSASEAPRNRSTILGELGAVETTGTNSYPSNSIVYDLNGKRIQ